MTRVCPKSYCLATDPSTRNHDVNASPEHTLEILRELSYARWRDYNPADTMRFYGVRLHEARLIRTPPSRLVAYALRLQEAGFIKSTPQKLMAEGTDWRLLRELKKELKA